MKKLQLAILLTVLSCIAYAQPLLTAKRIYPVSPVNLTTEGKSDWAKWSGYIRKATGGSKISNATVIGGASTNYTNNLLKYSWTDGTPTATGTNNANGVYITGVGKGFSITAPADAGIKILHLYVGGWLSTSTLTATLSDSSRPFIIDNPTIVTTPSVGQYDVSYRIVYRANGNATLKVNWIQSGGTGNVTLQAAALSDSIPPPTIVPVSGVTLNTYGVTLTPTAITQLTSTVLPLNAANKATTWSSSNSAIASVSSTGLVTAVAQGLANITVTTVDGNFSATCVATVNAAPVFVPVTNLTTSPSDFTLLPNTSRQVVATISPANATNKGLSWTSSNDSIATVNAGLVTAKTSGQVIITAKTLDNYWQATTNVSVLVRADTLKCILEFTDTTLGVSTTMRRVCGYAIFNTSRDEAGYLSENGDFKFFEETRFIKCLDANKNDYPASYVLLHYTPFVWRINN